MNFFIQSFLPSVKFYTVHNIYYPTRWDSLAPLLTRPPLFESTQLDWLHIIVKFCKAVVMFF